MYISFYRARFLPNTTNETLSHIKELFGRPKHQFFAEIWLNWKVKKADVA